MAREVKPKGTTPGKAAVQEKKSFSIAGLKDKMGLAEATKEKPLTYMAIEGALPGTYPMHEATGVSGPAVGYLSRVQGHSDTGKSTFVNGVICWCQENDTLPIILDTEGNFSFRHAAESGVQVDWVVDEETGEITPSGNFLYVNNLILWKLVGKRRASVEKRKHDAVTIEDLATFCYEMIDKQKNGDIPMNICLIWDALGTIRGDQNLTKDSYMAMWDAAAVKQSFQDIWFQHIPNSRSVESPYTITMLVVAKIRHDKDTGGMGSTELQGGKILAQASRLGFQLGNSMAAGTKAELASFDGKTTRWGSLVKVKVVKNHVEGASFESTIISTSHGFIANTPAAKEAYKRMYRADILKKLELDETADVDVKFTDADIAGEN